MPLPDCIGTKCHELRFETSDLKPEDWQVDGDLDAMGRQRVYPWPGPDNDQIMTQHMTAAQAAFTTAGEAAMDAYPAVVPGTCPTGCTCIPSNDPKDSMSVTSRVSVSATWPFPDGSGTMTVMGSFQLVTTRVEGLCTVGRPANKKAVLKVPDKIKNKVGMKDAKPKKQAAEKKKIVKKGK